MSYETLAKELKARLKESREHAEKIEHHDSEFDRLAKMTRVALATELKELRKEMPHTSIAKMAKHEIVNEILRVKLMLDSDTHVPHHYEEVAEALKAPKKSIQKRAALSAEAVSKAVTAPKRKGSPLLARVTAKRREGMSLKDAWAAVKAEEAPKKHQAPNPNTKTELEAAAPKAHAKMEKQYRHAKETAAARTNPTRADLAALMRKGHSFTEAAAILRNRKD